MYVALCRRFAVLYVDSERGKLACLLLLWFNSG